MGHTVTGAEQDRATGGEKAAQDNSVLQTPGTGLEVSL